MSNYKPPYLEKYHGRESRHTCPSCKQKQTFTLYLDGNSGKVIHRTVGRCNRENKCGYHYTPKQYLRDNPEIKLTDNHSQTNKHFQSNGNFQSNGHFQTDKNLQNNDQSQSNQQLQFNNQLKINPEREQTNIYEILKGKFDLIPRKYVINSASYNSNFVRFLSDYFPKEKIENAAKDYALGATRNMRVIFWQIDVYGNVRTGKIMQYNPVTGRRVKVGSGSITWVHSILKRRNRGMADFKLCQCYFGEHLLRLYPDKPVAIVEAEKTAVIGSMIYTDFIWLATGSLHGLNAPKSKVLKDRHVLLYPDAGCYEKWTGKMNRICRDVRCDMSVSDLVEKHATAEQLDEGYDIADYIIDKLNDLTHKED